MFAGSKGTKYEANKPWQCSHSSSAGMESKFLIRYFTFSSFAHVSALNDIFFFLLIHLAQIFKRWSWLENFVQPFYMVGWTSKGCSMKSEWQGGRHILYYDDRPKRLTVLEELLFLCDTITKCHLIGRADIQQQHFVSTKSDLVPFANFQKLKLNCKKIEEYSLHIL